MYLRQSRDRDGNELAVARQREDCAKLCADRGWGEAVEYVDNNVSASNRSKARPAWRRMCQDIEAGLINAVVVWDLDRLYRQPRELEDFIDLADDYRLQLATVTGDVDLSTDNGRLYARIKGAVAKSEGERKAERWKRSYQQGAAAGRWVATYRPFGYDWGGEPLEPEATLVRAAYADVLAGKSLRRIALDWNAAGHTTPDRQPRRDGTVVSGKPWTNTQVRRLLLNPRYAGLRALPPKEKGVDARRQHPARLETTKGDWTPLVDEDTWRGLCALLRDESRAVNTTFEILHMGAGVYRCGRCGAPMQTKYDKGGHRLYACRATPHLTRRAQPVDDMVAAMVLERLARPDALVLVEDGSSVDVGALHSRREALAARKDELSTLFAEGVLDGAAVRRDAAKLAEKIAGIDRQLADAVRVNPVASLLTGDTRLLHERWNAMGAAQRGQVIEQLVTVTIQPCPLGLRRFAPEYVEVVFRDDSDSVDVVQGMDGTSGVATG